MSKPLLRQNSSDRIRREGDRVTIDLCSKADLLGIAAMYVMFVGICVIGPLLPKSPGQNPSDNSWIGLALFCIAFVTILTWPTLRNWGKTVIFDSRGVSFQKRGTVLWQFPWEMIHQIQIALPGFMVVKMRFVAADGELLGILPMLRERPVYKLIPSLAPSHVSIIQETEAGRLRPLWWHATLAIGGTLGGLALLVWSFYLCLNLNPWAGGSILLGFTLLSVGLLNIGVAASHRSRRRIPFVEVVRADPITLQTAMGDAELSDGIYAYPESLVSRPAPRFTLKPVLIGLGAGALMALLTCAAFLLPFQERRSVPDTISLILVLLASAGAMGALMPAEAISKYKRLAKGFPFQIVIQSGDLFVQSNGQLHRPDQYKMTHVGHGKYELMIRFGKDRTYFDPEKMILSEVNI